MTLELTVPQGLATLLGCSEKDLPAAICFAAAAHWYAQGRISQEKAASLAGLGRDDFLTALARERIDVFAVDVEALRAEIERD